MLFPSCQISMSNWAAVHLRPTQILYAALDALMTGEAFRLLRAVHSDPSQCSACEKPTGNFMESLTFECGSPNCKKSFRDISALQTHCRKKSHNLAFKNCEICGRTSPKVFASNVL